MPTASSGSKTTAASLARTATTSAARSCRAAAMGLYRDFRGAAPDVKHLLTRRGLDATRADGAKPKAPSVP